MKELLGEKVMKTKNVKKVLLLVAITILLVGLVSATTTNQTSTSKDTKVVKDTANTNVKTATKTMKEPVKKVTNNKTVTKNKITKKQLNQTKKTTGTKTYDVSDFNTLNSALTNEEYNDVNLNIKSNIKLTDNTELSTSIYTLNINGNGKTIDGCNKFQFLSIKDSTVTLKNIKIINCYATYGGTIVNNGGEITITNSTLENNKAGSLGGTIRNYNEGKITITDSEFNNNQAGEGGVISSYNGTVYVENNIFKNNKATYGGAISLSSIYTNIENNLFINNSAKEGSALELGTCYTYENKVTREWVPGHYEDGHYEDDDGRPIYVYGTTWVDGDYKETYETIEIPGITNVQNNTFIQNKATTTGSVITNNGKNNTITNNINQYSSTYSSTISIVENGANITITRNTFQDTNYIPSNNEKQVSKGETPTNNNITTKLTIKLNTTKLYKGSKVKATVTLKDNKGKILKNQKVTIKFGSKTYTIKTNSKGIATKTYKTTKTGTIKVTSTFAGTTKYKKSTKTTKIKVLPKIKTKLTLKLSKSKVKVKDKIKVKVTLKNKSSKAIKNQKVAIKIGSKTYNKKTNKKGTISFTYKVVKAALGKAIKATYKGNYMYLSSKASKKLLKA